ncbi:hypothetical protein CVIRNUC_005193 [Coccomyxa viridis]|uniref:Major facilitator superfamily (MFS) profile domain-containing protein n=1 Tax=Coccomyxa viridis TaxID=1274662 RepID=A0AAV1I7H9_9CHLO|nr:hypothetical protein CVIRNUC_005193 [Coccomyxa viridis]
MDRLSGVWRTAFGLGIIPLAFIIYWRTFRLRESAVWAAAQTGRNRKRETDFSFYGNKLFQSEFIQILSPGASLLTTLLWTLLNSGCALIGYYFTAALVDNPMVGRLRIQIFGFIGVGTLFMVSAGAYGPLTTPGGIGTFQFLYFFSSFVGQFGPNCTTFLLAGELYPTQVRTTAHGMSAGIAKVGALWASVWFNYLGTRQKFWITASFNFGGALLTLLFMPDPLRLSLTELDRRFSFIAQGKTYHGEAINPKSLSLWEMMTHTGRDYDPQMDAADMQHEKVPQWRVDSIARHSAIPAAQQGQPASA